MSHDPNAPSADSPPGSPAEGASEVVTVTPVEQFHVTLSQLTRRIWVTYAIVAANVAVFILMVANGVSFIEPSVADLITWGGNYGPETTSGEWWRLVSCAFVHVGALHLVFNMYVLAAAGPLIERLVGNLSFALMYLISALAGSLASVAWQPMVVSAGASGAVFGVYGALLGFIALRRGCIPGEVLMSLRNSTILFIGYNVFFGLLQPQIDMAAHLGGLAAGFVCGLVLSQPVDLAAVAQRPRRAALVGALGVVLVAGGVVAMPRATDIEAVQQRLVAVETEYKEAAAAFDAGELSIEEFAAKVEGELLPRWRAGTERMAGARGLSGEQERMRDTLVEMMRLQSEQWELVVAYVRTRDEALAEKLQANQARIGELQQQLERADAP